MPIRRLLAVLTLLEALEAASQVESWLNVADFRENQLTTHSGGRVERTLETGTSPNGELVLNDKGLFSKTKVTVKQTTDSNVSPRSSTWCRKYGRKKRSRYKLSDELIRKEPGRDILAQLDYDIEEQEMDKRSRIELLSYLDAALKNKNIELNLELRHLAKEEENLHDKQQVESMNSNAAVLKANIEQLNKRIKDLDERTLRMKKMKQQQLPEKIPELKEKLNLLSQQNYLNSIHPSSAKEDSGLQTMTPFYFTKSVEIGKPELLMKDMGNRASISKQTSRANLGFVPYQMPLPYSDPLQILRLTNPDFAALAQPAPWLNPSWAGYAPNLYAYPVERQYPQSLYAAMARHQALPVPLRKV